MPVYKEYQSKHYQMLIYKVDAKEDLSSLTDALSLEDQKKLRNIKNLNRRRDFFAARQALFEILGIVPQLSFSEKGAPLLANFKGVSLSHNGDYAVAMLSKTLKVGVDLEAYRPQLIKLQHRFLNKQELRSLNGKEDIERLCAYWSLKESFIKLLDAPELDLRQHIRLSPFAKASTACGRAHIIHKGERNIYPWYLKMEKDFCLSFTMA